jgi:putative oxidoreductase
MNNPLKNTDLALLLLRLTVGGLMLFHGVYKIQSGIGPIESMLAAKGLPEGLALGIYLGELVAPLLLVIGFLTRPAGFLLAATMGVAIWLAYGVEAFTLTKHGGLSIELNLLYMAGGLALCLTGGGRYSVSRGEGRWS